MLEKSIKLKQHISPQTSNFHTKNRTSTQKQFRLKFSKERSILHSKPLVDYFLSPLLLPPPEVAAPAAFFAAFSCKAFASLNHKNKWNHFLFSKRANIRISVYLSRRCSGVNPSSLFFPLPPVRACALSRSRSLWLPRANSNKSQIIKENKTNFGSND